MFLVWFGLVVFLGILASLQEIRPANIIVSHLVMDSEQDKSVMVATLDSSPGHMVCKNWLFDE